MIPFDPAGKTVEEMLVDGAFDAAIIGTEIKDEPRVATLIRRSRRDRARLVRAQEDRARQPLPRDVGADLPKERPDVVREVYRMIGAVEEGQPADDRRRRSAADGLRGQPADASARSSSSRSSRA